MFHFFAAHSLSSHFFPVFDAFFLFEQEKNSSSFRSFPAVAHSPKVALVFAEIPRFGRKARKWKIFFKKVLTFSAIRGIIIFVPSDRNKKMKIAPIAQLDRAFDYESKGHRFESCWVHHEKPLTSFAPLRVFLCIIYIFSYLSVSSSESLKKILWQNALFTAFFDSFRIFVVVKTVVKKKKKKAGSSPASIYKIINSASKHIRHLNKHIDAR